MTARELTAGIRARETHTAEQGNSLRQDIHNPVLHRFSVRARPRITLRVITGRRVPARNILIPGFKHKILPAGLQQHQETVEAHLLARGDTLLRATLPVQEVSNTIVHGVPHLQEVILPVIPCHPSEDAQEAVTVAEVAPVPAVAAEVVIPVAVVVVIPAVAAEAEGKTIT